MTRPDHTLSRKTAGDLPAYLRRGSPAVAAGRNPCSASCAAASSSRPCSPPSPRLSARRHWAAPGGPGSGPDPVAGSTGADWLAGQLTDGLVHNDQYAFDDYGLTIDVALGLAAAGGQDARVATVAGAVADHVDELHHRRRLRLLRRVRRRHRQGPAPRRRRRCGPDRVRRHRPGRPPRGADHRRRSVRRPDRRPERVRRLREHDRPGLRRVRSRRPPARPRRPPPRRTCSTSSAPTAGSGCCSPRTPPRRTRAATVAWRRGPARPTRTPRRSR